MALSDYSTTKNKTATGLSRFLTPTTTKTDTKTSAGLYNLAVQSGLQADADRILSQQKGEEVKKIFSGGFISDIFDVLNSLQYGVVGVLKGKGFLEGVRTRQSWSDKDALGNNGLPGVVAGIALDIASDPLTYIAPATILKKVPGLAKLGTALKTFAFGKKVTKAIDVGTDVASKSYETIEGGSKLGKYLANKFVYMFGKDPVYRRIIEQGSKNTAVTTMKLTEMTKGVSQLTPELSSKILVKKFFPELKGERWIRAPLKELQKVLKPDEFSNVATFYNKIDNLGKEAVDFGILSKEKFEQNLGEYITNRYTEYELSKGKGIFGFMKQGIKGTKARKALTPEEIAKLGQIDNPAYLLFKSAFDLTKDVENAKIFKATAEKFGTDIAQEGFKQLPKTARVGELAGKYVPEGIFDAIQEISNPAVDNIGKQLVANFKFSKVILNPATHARNIVSNQILNWWKLGMNPLDPRTLKAQGEAIGEIAKKGGKWIDEAKTAGYGLDTFQAQELATSLINKNTLGLGGKAGNAFEKAKSKLGNIYQQEENFAKLSAFIFNRKKGVGIEEAWKMAESATFNYAQVTPFIRKLRTSIWGAPFITFSVKSAPVIAETALKAPGRISIFGKVRTAIENQSDLKTTEAEKASEPAYIKDGFYIKLPMKDKNGNSAYFDLTYIIPFGDLISGQFFQRKTETKTGLPESVPSALMGNLPVFQLLKEIGKNEDFYGDKLWRESDPTEKQVADLMRHLTKTYMPPLVADQIPGGYKEDGTQRQKGIIQALQPQEKASQQRTLMQEMLRNVGIKIQPIDSDIQQTYQEWNAQKALQNLLREKGVLKSFDINYVPK